MGREGSSSPFGVAGRLLLTVFGATFIGNSVTNQVQNGPSTCFETTDLSTPEYLYWSTPANCSLVMRILTEYKERQDRDQGYRPGFTTDSRQMTVCVWQS